jgi:hypothetical protein
MNDKEQIELLRRELINVLGSELPARFADDHHVVKRINAALAATAPSAQGQERVDAQRYRELKRQNTCGKNGSLVVFMDEDGNLLPVESDQALDELIDAALATSQEGGKT